MAAGSGAEKQGTMAAVTNKQRDGVKERARGTGPAGEPMQTQWHIQLFGALQAQHGDQLITRFRTRKTGHLLACLACHLHRTHRREELMEQLWPESNPDTARTQLRHQVYLLRHLLEPPGTPAGSVLVADRTSLRLNAEAISTDVSEFEAALVAAKRAEGSAERVARLIQSVELYRGELLPGCFEDWVQQERQWLAERYFQALGELVTHLEQVGEFERAVEYVRRGVRADPLREEAHRDLICLLAVAGQPDAALRQYAELQRLLAEKLGAEPSPEVRALARELQGRKSGDKPPRVLTTAALTPPDRPTSSPPEPAAEGNLPFQLTRFFGRTAEIARLWELLQSPETRLVTLIGPGGSGKTRLALTTAGRLQAVWPGPIWYVPLADLTDPRLITDRVLDALRLPRSPQLDPMEQVVAHLSGQPSLLLLDNCEHLLPEGAAVVPTLLEQVEPLTVLVTSRQRLGVPGEHLLPVPPLPTPGEIGSPEQLRDCVSVRLFVDRAQAVRPDFQLTAANAAAVAALCTRLEGMPLALELAAARSGVLTPEQMQARLRQPLELLRDERRQVAARHQSLRAALDWSYQLLSPELQRFFTQLSVFRGGFTLEAAEAVCQQPQAVDLLSALAAASLIVVEEQAGGMRYRLLEPLREYAAEELDPAGRDGLARRHAGYFLSLAEQAGPQLIGPEQGAWLERLEREHDNLRAALDGLVERGETEEGLRLGAALGRFWEVRGHLREGRRRLAELLALPRESSRPDGTRPERSPAPEPEPEAVRRSALRWAANLEMRSGSLEVARSLYEQCLADARAADDLPFTVVALHGLGVAAEWQGNLVSAQTLLEESLAFGRVAGDRHVIASVLANLGQVACGRGETAVARPLFEESLSIQRELGDTSGIADSLSNLGHLAAEEGAYTAARARYAESLALFRQLGNRTGELRSLTQLTVAEYLLGDYATARTRGAEGLAMARQMGDLPHTAVILLYMGEAARCQRDYAAAAELFGASLPLFREWADPYSLAGTLANLGHVFRFLGDTARAREFLAESLSLYRSLQYPRGIAVCLEAFAGVAVAEGNPERAARLLGAAALLRETGGGLPWPADRADNERNLAAIRATLDEPTFTAAWSRGRATSLEQIMANALDPSLGTLHQ
jgi:predicted ATPase/DNA-binding SARP family transcriptional activator/uncharacterized protein HemY